MFKSNLKFFGFLVVIFCFVIPKQALAYIDPGTGSYLFQFVIAGLLGGTYFMRGYIVKIKDKLIKKRDAKKTDDKKKS